MFDVLPASGSHQSVKTKWVMTSMIAHVVLMALAVMATRDALEATRRADSKEPMLLFFPRTSVPEPTTSVATGAITEPPPELETLPSPSEIPSPITPMDLTRRIDPRDLVALGSERRTTDGVVGTGTVARPDGIYEATSAPAGFEPAILLSQPEPKYPATLLSAGLAGAVLVEFVIDTTGRVEAGSIRMVESSHQLFEAAARSAVLGAKFRPARLSGRAVRQITRQRVRFLTGE